MGVIGNRTASEETKAARRALEGLEGFAILDDWEWFEPWTRWVLHIRICISAKRGSRLPNETDWYVLVEPDYPLGSIKFFPSKENSFSETYPHQLYNGPGTSETDWRTGELCLNTQIRKYDRYEDEPFEPEERLLWHCRKAVEWLNDAANDQLAKAGEPFELPQFPGIGKDLSVAYSEDSDSFNAWLSSEDEVGLVEFFSPRTPKNLFVVKRFLTLGGRELRKCKWGSYLEHETTASDVRRGIWMRTPSIPVLSPWQSPTTWGELRQAFETLKVDLDRCLRICAAKLRDGRPHIGLVGFGIPGKIGDPSSNMCWQALALPILANGNLRGFRNSETSYWQYDRNMLFSDNKPITWVSSENWDVGQVSGRGKLGDEIRQKSILLIGAGALGSTIAELLVRGGVQKLTLFDSENMQVGNLTRHTLTIEDVGSSKALGLAARLNRLSPHASVAGFNFDFPPSEEERKRLIEHCDVIVDCTGSDEVVRRLDAYQWKTDKVFFSISIGFDARRIFCFKKKGRFNSGEFFSRIRPWLELERSENAGRELPREGIGCWNPVFPARCDEVWLLVSSVVALFDDLEMVATSNPILTVFERVLSEGYTVGVKQSTAVEEETK